MKGSLQAGIRRGVRRPAVLLAVAVLLVPFATYLATRAWHAAEVGRVVDKGRMCLEGEASDCLTEVRGGELLGPYHQRRSRNDEWLVMSGSFRDLFQTSPGDSDVLRGAPIRGVFAYEGHVAQIVTMDDDVRPLHVGARGAVERASWALTLLSFSVAAVASAFHRRRALGGWWRKGEPADPDPWRDRLTVALCLPPVMAASAMTVVGTSWQTGLIVGAVTIVLAAYGLFRRSRGRHSF